MGVNACMQEHMHTQNNTVTQAYIFNIAKYFFFFAAMLHVALSYFAMSLTYDSKGFCGVTHFPPRYKIRQFAKMMMERINKCNNYEEKERKAN